MKSYCGTYHQLPSFRCFCVFLALIDTLHFSAAVCATCLAYVDHQWLTNCTSNDDARSVQTRQAWLHGCAWWFPHDPTDYLHDQSSRSDPGDGLNGGFPQTSVRAHGHGHAYQQILLGFTLANTVIGLAGNVTVQRCIIGSCRDF
jgi:hypothetical protein